MASEIDVAVVEAEAADAVDRSELELVREDVRVEAVFRTSARLSRLGVLQRVGDEDVVVFVAAFFVPSPSLLFVAALCFVFFVTLPVLSRPFRFFGTASTAGDCSLVGGDLAGDVLVTTLIFGSSTTETGSLIAKGLVSCLSLVLRLSGCNNRNRAVSSRDNPSLSNASAARLMTFERSAVV